MKILLHFLFGKFGLFHPIVQMSTIRQARTRTARDWWSITSNRNIFQFHSNKSIRNKSQWLNMASFENRVTSFRFISLALYLALTQTHWTIESDTLCQVVQQRPQRFSRFCV